jgi:hypothetical protein
MHIIRKNNGVTNANCIARNSGTAMITECYPMAAMVARYVDVMLAAVLFKPRSRSGGESA